MKNIFLLFLLLFVFSCQSDHRSEERNAVTEVETATVVLNKEQLVNADIVIGRASKQVMKQTLRVTGIIDVPPQNMVSVSFPLGGYLRTTKLLPGMHVRKGEIIARMEDPQYIQLQQDYLTAKARNAFLEAEYMRQKELNLNKASSDKVFQQAEAEYRTNKILISGLGEKLKLIGIQPEKLNENSLSRTVNISAPIDGFVSSVKVNVGKYVASSDVLFELVNPADVHLALTVFEKDISSLFIGQKLVAYTNNDPSKKYPCEVILIGKDVSAERSIQVHCHFDEYDHALVPGMFMNAEIETDGQAAFVVPEESVVRYGDKQFVFVSRGEGKFDMNEVGTGPAQKGLVALTDTHGLDMEQTDIVTKNAYTLLMKLKNTGE